MCSSQLSKNQKVLHWESMCIFAVANAAYHSPDPIFSEPTLMYIQKGSWRLLHYKGSFSSNNNFFLLSASICHEFLRRQWYDLKGNREKGAVLNGQLAELLSSYLSLSEDQLSAVTSITTWLSAESNQLSEKDSSLTTFPAFSR